MDDLKFIVYWIAATLAIIPVAIVILALILHFFGPEVP